MILPRSIAEQRKVFFLWSLEAAV